MKKSIGLPVILAALFLSLAGANSFGQGTNLEINTAVIPAMRTSPTNWLSRHEGFVQEARTGQIDLLFMGDSITDGWRRKSPPGRWGFNIWNKYYAPLHAANFGIGGDKTQHVIWRIEHGELDGLHPKAIVLMIGTNNSRDNTPEQIAAAIKTILDDIQQKCPGTKVLLLGVFPRNTPKDTPQQIDAPAKVNAIISQYANGTTIRYLNINDQFLGPDGKVPADIMPDFLHPNEHGYQLWADAMNPTLFAMVGISK